MPITDRDLRTIKPYVDGWIQTAVRSIGYGTVSSSGSSDSGGGSGDGITEAEALALFYTKTQSDSWRGTHESSTDIHHAQVHPFLGSDHTVPGGLGVGHVIWSPDGIGLDNGLLPHFELTSIGENDHHNRNHPIGSADDHTFPAISNYVLGFKDAAGVLDYWIVGYDHRLGYGFNGGVLRTSNSGQVFVEEVYGDLFVETPEIRTAGGDDLFLNPYTNQDIVYPETADFVSDNHVSQESGILLRPLTGLIDARTIQVKNIFAEAFIVQAKRAENGASYWTKGVTQTTREFTIPSPGASANLYVASYEGLSGFDIAQTDDDFRLFFLSQGQLINDVSVSGYSSSGFAEGVPDGGDLFSDDFESQGVGTDTGSDWRETGDGNSMSVDGTKWEIANLSGSNRLVTTANSTNAHIHYDGAGASSLSDYQVTGTFLWEQSDSALGITLLSQFGPSGSDEYYRIRYYNGISSVQASTHGSVSLAGTTDSGFTPVPGTRYEFKAQVEDTGTQTEVRFRIWEVGTSEPGTWQIDAYDDTGSRNTTGTFGFWTYLPGGGSRGQIDDVLLSDLNPTSGTYAEVTITQVGDVSVGDVEVIQLAFPGSSGDIIQTSGEALTLAQSLTHQGYVHRVYYRRHTGASFSDWVFTLSNANYGPISWTCTRLLKVVGTGDPIEVNYTDVVSSGTQLFSGPHTVTAGARSIVLIAQHNTAVTDQWVDNPNDFALFNSVNNTNAPSLFTQGFSTGQGGGTSVPSVTWTNPQSVNASLIELVFTPIAASGGSFAMGSTVGTVTGPIDPGDLEDDEQCYTFTTKPGAFGAGVTVGVDATVLNYGDYDPANPQGIIEITTLDQAGSPYMRLGIRDEYDPLGGYIPTILRGQFGNLDGIATYGPNEWGILMRSGEGVQDGEFAITTLQSFLKNIPFSVLDALGQLVFEIDIDRGVVVYSDGNRFNGERAFTFRDVVSEVEYFELGGYVPYSGGAPTSRNIDMKLDAGNFSSGTSTSTWQQWATGSGISHNIYMSLLVSKSNPSGQASLYLEVSSNGDSRASIGGDTVDYTADLHDMTGEIINRPGAYSDAEFRFQNTGDEARIRMMKRPAAYSDANALLDIGIETIQGFSDYGLQFRDILTNTIFMKVKAIDPWVDPGDRFFWFDGPIWSGDGSFIAGYSSFSSVDHIHYNETYDSWNFVANGPFTSTGNANIALGRIFIQDGVPTSVSIPSGYAMFMIDQADGNLKIRFSNGTWRTIVTD